MKKNLLLLILLSYATLFSQTNCSDFKLSDFKINGSTTITTNEATLTRAIGNQGGSIWSNQKIDLSKDFKISTELNFGTNDGGGADGIAFVLQPLSSDLGGSGGVLGFQGISPSIAIEFDTWFNAGIDPLPQDHIAIIKNGRPDNISAHSEFNPPIVLPNIEDGLWHEAVFEWNATTQKLKVTFDNIVRFDTTINIVNSVFLGNTIVYWGFTAATGAAVNIQKVKLKNYCVTLETCSNIPEISASANTVCSGTAVSLTAGTTIKPFGNTCTLPTNLQTGLVGYWPFCGNANDTSGNNNNGTVIGATLTSDRFGNVDSAYSFDGVNDFIETNRTHLNSFTASVWIKLNISNCFSAILDAYPSSWEFLSDCVSGTNLSTAIWNNSTAYQIYQSNYIIPQNKWVNVVMTYGNNILKIYSEGNLVYTGTTIAPRAINGLFYFGRSRSGTEQFFNGKLDDVAIWNKILTTQEINQLYTPEISYLWSTGETSATINPTPTATTTYWCDVNTNGSSCRKSITITVKNTPAPTGAAKQQFCNDSTIAALAVNGTSIKWYTSATSTTTLTNNNTLINGTTYFATQTIEGCESINRFQTTVSIVKVPTPKGDGIQKFCLEGNPIVSNLIVTGNSIIWFDALTDGIIIDNATLLQDNTTYFATTLDTATGCESIQRLAVKVDLFKCNITAYNLITINGNSLNDQLTFEDISYFPDNLVKIYNRYGKLVWETSGYDNTNNAFKGKANVSGVFMKDSFLPAGTYFYILEYKNMYIGKQTELTGYLQIDNAN